MKIFNIYDEIEKEETYNSRNIISKMLKNAVIDKIFRDAIRYNYIWSFHGLDLCVCDLYKLSVDDLKELHKICEAMVTAESEDTSKSRKISPVLLLEIIEKEAIIRYILLEMTESKEI